VGSANGFRAVFFDLDGTLRHSHPAGGEAFSAYAAQQGLSLTKDDRLRAARWEHYYWATSPELRRDLQAYQGDEDAFWLNYSSRRLTALGCPPERLEELAGQVSRYMKEEYQPVDRVPADAPAALAHLRRQGYILGVVSNRDNPCDDLLQRLGLGQHIDFSLVAGEVQSWKPDAGIFHHAVQRAGTTAIRSVYVGDNYYADIVGARNAGLQPILYDPNGIFPDPGCPVITTFSQLPGTLERI
jgi:FMN phosphatase YigB (HAD superfamily)